MMHPCMACSAPSFALFTCIGGSRGCTGGRNVRCVRSRMCRNWKASGILDDGVHFPTLGRGHHVQIFFFDYESKKRSGVQYHRRRWCCVANDTYLVRLTISAVSPRRDYKNGKHPGRGILGKAGPRLWPTCSVVEQDDRFGAPENTNRASVFGASFDDYPYYITVTNSNRGFFPSCQWDTGAQERVWLI
ncbi:hypothetical protein EDB89DRAFT_290308 [Lactarius sanguifluus]|nr:hypothetical protein EDB89DRAFT_290308 [Lactarius sanguifluus]